MGEGDSPFLPVVRTVRKLSTLEGTSPFFSETL